MVRAAIICTLAVFFHFIQWNHKQKNKENVHTHNKGPKYTNRNVICNIGLFTIFIDTAIPLRGGFRQKGRNVENLTKQAKGHVGTRNNINKTHLKRLGPWELQVYNPNGKISIVAKIII